MQRARGENIFHSFVKTLFHIRLITEGKKL